MSFRPCGEIFAVRQRQGAKMRVRMLRSERYPFRHRRSGGDTFPQREGYNEDILFLNNSTLVSFRPCGEIFAVGNFKIIYTIVLAFLHKGKVARVNVARP
jgi:hypothetical protein